MGLVIDKRLGWLFHNHDGANDSRYLLLDASNDPITGPLTINNNSTAGLLVEQTGVKSNVLVVDTTNAWVGVNGIPEYPFDVLSNGECFNLGSHINATVYMSFASSGANRRGVMGFRNGAVGDASGSMIVQGGDTKGITFITNSTTFSDLTRSRMFVSVAGYVGVGTNFFAPLARLHVSGGNDIIQNIIQANGTQTANIVEIQKSDATVYGGWDKVGTLFMAETTTPTAVANFAKAYPKADNRLYWQDGAGTEKTIIDSDDTYMDSVPLTSYDPSPGRANESNVHGGVLSLATGQPLDSGTDLVVTQGIGKLVIVINTGGGDYDGEITVTGTTVDRETGVATGGQTDTITVDAITTDNSDTDTNSNIRHAFTGAYITSKWFSGTVTLSTTNLTLTDVDVYHVSFEQFNDQPDVTVTTFDINCIATNVNADVDAYLYALEVTGDKCDISRIGNIHLGADGVTPVANKYYRLRNGNIGKALNGSTDGIWVDVHYNATANVEDVTMKVWSTRTTTMTLV